MKPNQRKIKFEASCGTEIVRRRTLPSRRTWSACGEVMDRFHNEIMPDIKALLENADSAHVEYYISIVMVGWSTAAAKPKILISCINQDVRDDILNLIRTSHIPVTYPKFGLGSSAVPLHEPLPSGPTAGKSNATATSHGDQGDRAVLAFDHEPSVGRKLFVSADGSGQSRSATGGVVIRVGDAYYQITVGHFEEPIQPLIQQWSQEDLDYCSFDDDSDEEQAMLELVCDITSLGSLSPSRTASDEYLLHGASYDEDSEAWSPTINTEPITRREILQSPPRSSIENIAMQAFPQALDRSGVFSEMRQTGRLQHNSRLGNRPDLDYALVLLSDLFDIKRVNRLRADSNTNRHIQARGVVSIPTAERHIVTMTASGGFARGRLRPSAVYLRTPDHTSLQKLFVVQLSTVILEGDCGAEVLDEETGDLYGHIVRGCRGTHIAYIVSAKDVFEDLHTRLGIVPSIVCPDHIEDTPASDDATTREKRTGAEQNEATESDGSDASSRSPASSYHEPRLMMGIRPPTPAPNFSMSRVASPSSAGGDRVQPPATNNPSFDGTSTRDRRARINANNGLSTDSGHQDHSPSMASSLRRDPALHSGISTAESASNIAFPLPREQPAVDVASAIDGISELYTDLAVPPFSFLGPLPQWADPDLGLDPFSDLGLDPFPDLGIDPIPNLGPDPYRRYNPTYSDTENNVTDRPYDLVLEAQIWRQERSQEAVIGDPRDTSRRQERSQEAVVDDSRETSRRQRRRDTRSRRY